MAAHNDLGKQGEELAVDYLRKKGYEILSRNFRYQKAEVDIIAEKAGILVAIEVKTRSTSEFGDPQEFVKPKQIKLLVKAMNHYVETQRLDVEIRFDIIAVIINRTKTSIDHIQDAFLYF